MSLLVRRLGRSKVEDASAAFAGDDALAAERLPLNWRQEARSKGAMALVEGLDDRNDDGLDRKPDVTAPLPSVARVLALAWMPDNSFGRSASLTPTAGAATAVSPPPQPCSSMEPDRVPPVTRKRRRDNEMRMEVWQYFDAPLRARIKELGEQAQKKVKAAA